MKKIFINGSNGFIGRNLKEHFQEKYQLFTPSHQELDLLDADQVRNYIRKNRIDIIIHCANIGGGRDTVELGDVVQINLRMFFNIARNEEMVSKIIHFGSGAEYDKSRPLKKVREEDFSRRVPVDDYGFYKYICSKYIEKAKNIICLRLFGVYGKYEDYRYKFISNSIVKNLLNLPLVINQNVIFDYLYIDDLVAIVRHFLEKKVKHRFYNLTPSSSIDLTDICQTVNAVSDFKSKIKVINQGLNNEYTGDNTRLRKEIPGLSFTGYNQGIKDLFLYYRKILSKIDRNILAQDKYIKYCRTKLLCHPRA